MHTDTGTERDTVVRWPREQRTPIVLVGQSPIFLEAIRTLSAIARSDASVLVTGETGTGKELVAKMIHDRSPRAGGAFVPLNCGSLPETLIEAELFGHERGAFTDAHRQRQGLIAEAESGTLFLDEVDSLTPRAQVTLLRVLQERRFRRVGASQEHHTDVRIIAATNADLGVMTQAGRFRVDLYYRLHVFSLHLPPLRERKEDILPLAALFLEKHSPPGSAPHRLAPSAVAALSAYDWPGNVRELESAIIRGIHMSATPIVEEADLGLSSSNGWWPGAKSGVSNAALPALRTMKREVLEAFERAYLTRLLALHGGNLSQAARTAGKERRELGKLLKKYRIEAETFRRAAPCEVAGGCVQRDGPSGSV